MGEGRPHDRPGAGQLVPEHRQHLRLELARDRDPDRPQRRPGRGRSRGSTTPTSTAGSVEVTRDRGRRRSRPRRRAPSSASGGSFSGGGTVQAINGQIATNVVLSKAHASIDDSNIDTTGDVAPRGARLVRDRRDRARRDLEWRPRRQHRARVQLDRLAVAERALQHHRHRPRRLAVSQARLARRAGRDVRVDLEHARRPPAATCRSRRSARSRSTRRSRTPPTPRPPRSTARSGMAVGGIIASNKIRSVRPSVVRGRRPPTSTATSRPTRPTRPGSSRTSRWSPRR